MPSRPACPASAPGAACTCSCSGGSSSWWSCWRCSPGSSHERRRLGGAARHHGRHRRLRLVAHAPHRSLNTYLKGSQTTGWGTIGLSVMATQASAITFLSIPGQGFESGIGFVQNYFGLPLALIIVCAVFLPMYRRLGVYTAYEFLGQRFDRKTRLLGRGTVSAATRPRRGSDHLRAGHHPLHRAGLAARPHHRVHRARSSSSTPSRAAARR